MEDTSKGPGSRLTDFERGYMKGLHDAGISVNDISSRMNIGRSTVYRLIEANFSYEVKEKRETLLSQ
jgi:IS30 family transposase